MVKSSKSVKWIFRFRYYSDLTMCDIVWHTTIKLQSQDTITPFYKYAPFSLLIRPYIDVCMSLAMRRMSADWSNYIQYQAPHGNEILG